MTDFLEENAPPYPNNLRQVREQVLLSRASLVLACKGLAEKDAVRFTALSISTIRSLEVGLTRPRLTTAATLAVALGVSAADLFPDGLDDPVRNPSGNTRITANRPRGGRPRTQ